MQHRPTISEAEFTKQVIELAQLNGFRVAHFRGVRVQRKDGSVHYCTPVQADGAGFPDLLMLRGRAAIVAELKVGANKPSEAQRQWLAAFEMTDFDVQVWRPENWDEIVKILY